MSTKDKHITSTEDFLKYTANKMSREERNAFEKKLQKDSFEDEAAEGLSQISSDEARSDLLNLSSLIRKRTKTRSNLIWYRIAASVAVLAIVSTVFFTLIKNKIEKGTGQLIVAESTSPQKEEKDLSKLQNISPEQPGDGNKTNAGAAGNQGIATSQIKDVQNTKKTEALEFATNQREEAKKINEISDLAFKETPAPVTRSAPEDKEKILQEKSGVNLQGQGLVNRPSKMKTVRGIVFSSEDSTPLPGVKIIVKGSNQETITDTRGKFTIPASQDSVTILLAQYAGMKMKETKLEDNSDIKIQMESYPLAMEEVAVGYASQKKLSKNIPEVKKDQFKSLHSPPLPINGIDSFNEYVRKNQVYPSTDLRINKAKVILNFLVRTDGRPDSIIVVKSQGKEFSVEAIRLLKEGPGWIPAIRNGEKVVEAVQVKIILSSRKE